MPIYGSKSEESGFQKLLVKFSILNGDIAYKNNSRCFVHCEMGINRSKFVESCFYYLVLGRHLESEDARIIGGRGFINALFKNTAKSIPLPLKKMECFLDILAEKCFHDDVSQNLLDDILLELSRRYP